MSIRYSIQYMRFQPWLASILFELESAEHELAMSLDASEKVEADRWRQDLYRVLVRYHAAQSHGVGWDPTRRLHAMALRRRGENVSYRWQRRRL